MQITFNGPVLGNPGVNIRGDVHVNYDGLEESKTYSGPTTIYSGGTLQISSNQTLGDIVLNSGATLIVDAGVTLTVTGSWTGGGTIQNNGTIVLAGTAAQTFPGAGSNVAAMNNLTINNPGGVTLDNSLPVNGTLTLTNGRLILGNHNLTLGASSPAIAGTLNTNNMVVAEGAGQLRKLFTTYGSYFFPVGDATGTAEYSPLTLNFASGTYGGGAYAAVRVNDAKHPNNGSTSDFLTRYWAVTSSGISSFSATVIGTFVPADITGAVGNMITGKWNGALPWQKFGAVGANTITAAGVTSFSDFTGITSAPPTVTITANPSLTICQNEPVTLTANPSGDAPFTFSWSTGATTASITPSTATVGSTVYTVTVTDVNGFTTSANVTVNVLALQTVTCPSNTSTCINSSAILLTGGTPAGGIYSGNGVYQSGANYYFDPVAAGIGVHTITYSLSNQPVAYWNFNTGSSGTPWTAPIASTTGSGSITAGSWIWGNINYTAGFNGSTQNAMSGDPAGASLSLIRGNTPMMNGRYFQVEFNMSGLADLVISYWSRKSSDDGFDNNQWSYSTDGVVFTNFGPVINPSGANGGNVYTIAAPDLLNGQPNVYLRYTLNGASTGVGHGEVNNRIDNLQLNTATTCSEPCTFNITVNDLPTITGTLEVCAGSPTQLTGSGTPAASNPWVSANTAIATVSNSGLVTGVSAGTSVITYTDINGCNQTATVTVYALPIITGTTSVCVGSSTQLTGSGTPAATNPWTTSNPAVATVSATGLVTGVSAGTSLITYTNNLGCNQSVTVTVNALPVAAATSISPVCQGSIINLFGQPDGMSNYSWTGPNGWSSMATTNSYSQDFNTLPSAVGGTWTNNITLTGWYARSTATANINAIGINTGTTTTGGLYSFGVAGANPITERSLGYAVSIAFIGPAGVGRGYLGFRLINTTGIVINYVDVTWTGEQWRRENNLSPQDLLLSYQTGVNITDLNAGIWTNTTSSFTSPQTGSSGTALDGNLAINRSQDISASIQVNILPGEEIMLRWEDLNDSGSDHLLAIDDVTITYGNTGLQNPTIPNATLAMSGDYFLTVTDPNGCVSLPASTPVVVNPTSVGGSVASDATVCVGNNSGTLTLSGHTGDVVRWEYSIDGGTNWLLISNITTTQDYTNLTQTTMYRAVVQSGACAEAFSATVTIAMAPAFNPGAHNTTLINQCQGYNPFPLTFLTSPSGGIPPYNYQWRLNGIDIPGETNSSFDPPPLTLPGIYIYDCIVTDACGTNADTDDKVIEIVPDPTVAITGVTPVCQNDPLTLTAVISNGVGAYSYLWQSSPNGLAPWTNLTGATLVTYNPPTNIAGTFYYRVMISPASGSCNNAYSDAVTVEVYALPVVTCPADFDVCVDAPAFALSGATPAGGAYSGTGVSGGNFDPSVAGVGTHVITYTYTDGNSCTNDCTFEITVNDLPVVTCPADFDVCVDAPAFALSGAAPAGGAFSGTGVSGGNFDPAVAGVGTHVITYTYTDGNSCTNDCTFEITVNDLPVVTCPADFDVCVDAPAFALSGAAPAGGTYSGTGVSGGIFDPAVAGVGTHVITYTYTDGNGCINDCTFEITVNALPTVTCPPDFEVCLEATAFPLTGATPIGGIYSGTGVIGGDFDPSVAGIGPHVITYTFTDVNGCENFCTFTITVSNGVVIVTASAANTGPACYPNLGEAFEAINDGTHQGIVTVSIHDNTTEPATAILNASGGTASYTSVVVSPAAPGISVTGDLNAPLIQLNGADNITFDGRVDAVGAPYSLTLNNTNAGNAATTIEFAAGAANNLIQFCNITGFNAIYSQGTAGNPNTENLITDNRIYDFLNPGLASNGIHLAAFNEYWTIQFNELYQTTPLVASANVEYAAIRVDAGTGNGFLVENNTIGSNGASGTWTKTGSNNVFYGIYISAGTGNSIAGNNIRDFNWTNTQNANWTGIHVAQGAVNITGNIVGAGSGAGNIQVTLGLTTAASNGIFGISHASGSASTISGNVIGAVTAGNSAANASNIYGIAKLGVPAPLTIENNQISGLQAASASTENNQIVYGIAYEVAGGIAVISGNTIQGLSNLTTGAGGQVHGIHTNVAALTVTSNIIFNLSNSAANETGESNAAVTGIVGRFTGNGTIAGNTIYNLQSTYAARGRAIGIYYNGTLNLTNHVSENFIHSLSVATVVPGPPFGEIYGIRTNFGQATVYNNIVSLGVGMSSNAYIYGIYENGYAGNNYNYYHNTIYIGGTSTQNENNSYAFFSGNNENQKDIRNNIFHNARTSSAGVTAFHYAAHYQTNANGLTSDYNVYYFPSGRFVRMGPPTPHIFYATLADWQTAYPAQDVHSVVANSNFANPGGTAAADYVPGNPYNGVDNTGITTDYTGTLRDCAFTRGAFEAAAGAVTAVFDPETSTRCQGAGTVIYSDSALVLNDVSVFYSIESTPAGAILVDAATGEVSYPAGWSGTVTITLTATGCNGPPVTATHVATTAGNVEAPVFDPAFSERCQGAETIIYTATAVNASGISYEIDATSQAGGVSIVSNTGAVTYPDTWNGITVITATAEGCGGPLTATHTVTTNPPVGIPVFDPGLLDSRCQGEEDVQYTATAANTTGITYSIDAASTAGGVSIDANTGLVSYPATWIGITTITASAAGCNGPAVETFVVETTTALTPSVSIEIDPPGGTCAGGELTFTAIPVHGGPSPSYQWRLNGVDVPGATSEVYGPVILNDGDVVRVTMISSDPCALPDPVFSVVTVSFGIVEVFSAANPSPTCYNTLGEAFTSINNGDYVGQISVRILASTTEPVSAVLNASGGLSSYTSVRVFPQSEGISVTGDIDGPLVHLNGADGVTLHGSPGGTGTNRSITYINTSTGSNATTIQINNGAATNTITYCNLRGSGTGADRGTVYIGGGGANTNNSILRNAFTGNGDNRPANSVYSFNGTGSNTVFVEFNEFYNFFSLNNNSNGVYLHTGTGTSRINDNRFYETSSFSPTADAEYAVIRFISMGSNTQINRNTIGGNTNAQNSHWIKQREHNNLFYAIYAGAGAGTIQRNSIYWFNWQNSGNASWTGIHVEHPGHYSVGNPGLGNTIGSSTQVDNIILTQGASTPEGSGFIGIRYDSWISGQMNSNIVSGISTNTEYPADACNFYGIYKYENHNGPFNFRSNIIGNPSASGSIKALSPSTGARQDVYGIYYNGTLTQFESSRFTFEENVVANLTNYSVYESSRMAGIWVYNWGNLTIHENHIHDLRTYSGNNIDGPGASLMGIYSEFRLLDTDITENTIYNLYNLSTQSTRVFGILFRGSASFENDVARNFIHGLSVSTAAPSLGGTIAGILHNSGVATYANNIISLGQSVSSRTAIFGVYTYSSEAANRFYFNTIYIGGTAQLNTNTDSYCFYSGANIGNNNLRTYINNIFYNERTSTSTTQRNAAFYYASMPTAARVNADWNQYYSLESEVIYVGSAVYNDVLTWRGASGGQDEHSLFEDPSFVSPGGLIAENYTPIDALLSEFTTTGIINDYFIRPRGCSNTVGAIETGQIQVFASVGPTEGKYETLGAAFTAINAGTHQGEIQVLVNCNTNEGDVTAILNASLATLQPGQPYYTWVHIYPTRPQLSITGNNESEMIRLDGADNVTFYGGVGFNPSAVDRDLTLENTFAGRYASTIRLQNDAQNNTIQLCTVKGSSSREDAGVITISGDGSNSGILITDNEFTASGGIRPVNVILAIAASSSGVISDNLFYDFLSHSPGGSTVLNANAIELLNGASGWTISENSFYETAGFNVTRAVNFEIIRVSTTSGSNFTITNNYIGGNAPLAAGAWTKNGNNNVFTGIYFNSFVPTSGIPVWPVQHASTSVISGNVIRGFNWTNSGNANWTAIQIQDGLVNVGGLDPAEGNVIGDDSGNVSITITNGATGGTFYGINNFTNSQIFPAWRLIQHNTIGGVRTNTTNNSAFSINAIANTNTLAFRPVIVRNSTITNLHALSSTADIQEVVGIRYNVSNDYITVEDNLIDNLQNGSNPAGGQGITSGIWIRQSARAIVSNNTVSNLTSAMGNSQSDHAAAVTGIVAFGYENLNVTGNTVHNLHSTFATGGLQVTGIVAFASGANPALVNRNFIHGFSLASQNTGAHMNGIRIVRGLNLTVFNNIVHLTTESTSARTIYGIFDHGAQTGDVTRIYYNTVMIGGVAPAANQNNSYGLWSSSGANNKDYQNNVFSNFRSNANAGATGRHYAVFFTDTPVAGFISDYNNLYASGTGGITGRMPSGEYPTLNAWQTATTQDAHSLSVDPVFALPGGSDPANYIPSAAMPGLTGLGSITDDFGTDAVRTDPVTMGAWENDCNLVITEQPADLIRCENDNASFTVVATGVGTPAYLWEFSTDNGVTWNVVPGQTPPGSSTLTIAAANNGLYRCVITFTNDPDPPCVIVSDWATLTVNPRPTTSAIWHQ